MLRKAFRYPIQQNDCRTTLLTCSIPSWCLAARLSLHISTTARCLVANRTEFFFFSLKVFLFSGPFNLMVVSLSTNGDVCPNHVSNSLLCYLQQLQKSFMLCQISEKKTSRLPFSGRSHSRLLESKRKAVKNHFNLSFVFFSSFDQSLTLSVGLVITVMAS